MAPIELLTEEQTALEKITRRATAAQRLVTRAKIILHLGAGVNHSRIARQLRLDRGQVIAWGQRWEAGQNYLKGEVGEEKTLSERIEEVLSDRARSGAPPTFTAEQIVQIVALACEKPEEAGRPLSHWSRRELAEEAVKRQIVEQISIRSVGRFLKSGGSQTAQSRILADGQAGR